MTIGPAGTESREPIYLPPSPHQEHMSLLKEMHLTLLDILQALKHQRKAK